MDNVYSCALTGNNGSKAAINPLLVCFFLVPQTVEEKRTVRDSQGKEETTITRSGGPRSLEGPEHQAGPLVPGHLTNLKCHRNKIFQLVQQSQRLLMCFMFFFRWPTSIFRHARRQLAVLQVLWRV